MMCIKYRSKVSWYLILNPCENWDSGLSIASRFSVLTVLKRDSPVPVPLSRNTRITWQREGFMHLRLLNETLSYEMQLTCYSHWNQKGDKEVFKSPSYIISYTVKMLRLTVTSPLGTLGGGAGGFGEWAILQLWMEARLGLTLFWYKPSCFIMWNKLFLILC